MGPPLEVDSNPDLGPRSTGGLSYPIVICIYTELNPEPILVKWSRVNRANDPLQLIYFIIIATKIF